MKGGGNMMGTVNSWGGFGFGWIFMIIFWGIIILGIIALIRYLANQGETKKETDSAIDILKTRYAKGEIDKKEFAEKIKDLQS